MRLKDAGVGQRVEQTPDSDFRLNMQLIRIPRGYLSQEGTAVDEVFHQSRATLGALDRPAATTRPDSAAACSIIPGYAPDRHRKGASAANAAARQAKEVSHDIALWPIPPAERRVEALCGSSADLAGS